MEYKTCCKCRISKLTTQFYKNKISKDGFQAICSPCKAKLYSENKDKLFPKKSCSCGRTVYEYYIEKHLKTNHKRKLNLK